MKPKKDGPGTGWTAPASQTKQRGLRTSGTTWRSECLPDEKLVSWFPHGGLSMWHYRRSICWMFFTHCMISAYFSNSPARQTSSQLKIVPSNFQAPRLVKHWRMARQDLFGEGLVGILQAVLPRDCESIEGSNSRNKGNKQKPNEFDASWCGCSICSILASGSTIKVYVVLEHDEEHLKVACITRLCCGSSVSVVLSCISTCYPQQQ